MLCEKPAPGTFLSGLNPVEDRNSNGPVDSPLPLCY